MTNKHFFNICSLGDASLDQFLGNDPLNGFVIGQCFKSVLCIIIPKFHPMQHGSQLGSLNMENFDNLYEVIEFCCPSLELFIVWIKLKLLFQLFQLNFDRFVMLMPYGCILPPISINKYSDSIDLISPKGNQTLFPSRTWQYSKPFLQIS